VTACVWAKAGRQDATAAVMWSGGHGHGWHLSGWVKMLERKASHVRASPQVARWTISLLTRQEE
jgi:hypothetical protein